MFSDSNVLQPDLEIREGDFALDDVGERCLNEQVRSGKLANRNVIRRYRAILTVCADWRLTSVLLGRTVESFLVATVFTFVPDLGTSRSSIDAFGGVQTGG